ncbi:cysteine proteinase, partial [Dissoconium aciculare CBS 342.82]|uniref:Cysteine proteinase n=1 Tax=Dissoconium aciculare CBS 342.82 TaxID=1314786 RepID=A0A6J3M4Y6_9PEZI
VTVNVEDLARLDEGEFLNDTILSFALREIEESMDTRRRQEIHMFNTFFYTALSTKLGRKAFNFEAVKKWTNKVNIFEFPYVVVPINVSQHWFCNALGPVIITLDSLGLTRSAEIRYLKDYIVAEANDKLGIALNPKDISGWTAKSIPQQTNFCDCGVLVVEYIRALAQDPHGFVKEMLRL